MSSSLFNAIKYAYPQVITVYSDGDISSTKAIDKQGNAIDLDENAINNAMEILKSEQDARIQAQAAAKQSALNKLMALGLTEEEALSLGVN